MRLINCLHKYTKRLIGTKLITMTSEVLSPMDPSSFSRPELALVKNIDINLCVNFDKKIFSGFVKLDVQKIDENVNEIILDTKDLAIENITETELNQDVKYSICENLGEFGSKLSIQLPEKSGNMFFFKIDYETSPKASGLQWLAPEQTAGKKHPYLFSQFQAIHARSFLPCQDTPAVKSKYSATISAPNDLTVLMSAIRDHTKQCEAQGAKLSHFVQNVPIPSYLIAIAIGALESRKIGPRSHVWAEKEFIEESAFEFANTEHQLKTAEDICGPYVWGIYDLLVLPPSFPYGGMENPCLTFVTPTLLAGDRSLANVVAHEIAHSWTGNLISNRNFEHFWLNEGFTVLLERKILGRLLSKQDQDFHTICGLNELKEALKVLGESSPFTKLVLDLKGVHPDDAYSPVPYEKGSMFLRYLEETVGGSEIFEAFLRKYFETYKYKSVVSDDFKNFFLNEFKDNEKIAEIDWDLWLYGTGLPPIISTCDNTMGELCTKLKNSLLEWDENIEADSPVVAEDVSNLSTDQLIHLLQELLEENPISIKKLQAIDGLFNLDSNKNAEIKFRWLRICLKSQWEDKVPAVISWLNQVGRMKYVRPLYRDLYNWEFSRQIAVENYLANKKYMMQVSAHTVARDLHIEE